MRERAANTSTTAGARRGERGVSIVELLIVILMIAVVSAYAFMRVAEAQQSARLDGAVRQLAAYLEKTRLDSVRRRATSAAQMATVTLTGPNAYRVSLDADGNGALDPPRNFRLPQGVTFNTGGAAYPVTIRYNWRGRTVNNLGQPLTANPFALRDSKRAMPVSVSSGGDTSANVNVNISNISGQQGSATESIRRNTNAPPATDSQK